MTLATWRWKCAMIWPSLINCYKALLSANLWLQFTCKKDRFFTYQPHVKQWFEIWSLLKQLSAEKITRRVPSENSFNLRLSKWASFTWILSLVHSLWQSYKTNDSCLRLWISHEVILGSMSLRTKHAIFELSSFPSHTNSKTHIFLIMPAWAWTTDRLSI